jgi:hypothetical protein
MAFDLNHARWAISAQLSKYEGWYSEAAAELLLLTMAAESDFGTYLFQVGGGPGRGVFQMESQTEIDIWYNWLRYRENIRKKVIGYTGVSGPADGQHLALNLGYQVAMARIHYLRRPEPLPNADDIRGLAEYWKAFWNTVHGKGTVEGAMEKYRTYIGI